MAWRMGFLSWASGGLGQRFLPSSSQPSILHYGVVVIRVFDVGKTKKRHKNRKYNAFEVSFSRSIPLVFNPRPLCCLSTCSNPSQVLGSNHSMYSSITKSNQAQCILGCEVYTMILTHPFLVHTQTKQTPSRWDPECPSHPQPSK